MAAGVSLVGIESLVVTVAAAPYSGVSARAKAGHCTGSTIPVAQITGAARAIVTGAMSIALVPSRAGLGLIVVAAR